MLIKAKSTDCNSDVSCHSLALDGDSVSTDGASSPGRYRSLKNPLGPGRVLS